MSDKMTLIQRLQNPAWVHSDSLFEGPQLEQTQILADMKEAASELIRLGQALEFAGDRMDGLDSKL